MKYFAPQVQKYRLEMNEKILHCGFKDYQKFSPSIRKGTWTGRSQQR